MNQKRREKTVSVVLCIVLLLTAFSGCGNRKTEEKPADTQGTETVVKTESVQSPTEEEEQSAPTTYVPLASGGQGRYMEEELGNFPEYSNGIRVTKEGVWVMGPKEAAFKPNGSDEFQIVPYPEEIQESYWQRGTVNDEGEMVFACFEHDYDRGIFETVLKAVKKDGTVIELDRSTSQMVGDMEFGPDGKLYLHHFGGRCGIYRYELKEGEGEFVFATSSTTDDLTFMGNILLAADEGQVWIYDIENSELKESDSVLNDFYKENIPWVGDYDVPIFKACIFGSGEENILYLVCEKGIFRHVLYGGIMEQLANGELNLLSDQSASLQGAGAWEDENGNIAFLVDLCPGRVMRYVYDPDTPTVPEKVLRVYSLNESTDIRQIITLFQQEHPECYVKYEVGTSGAVAADVGDIIKRLNTAILSGNGPDILFTDGLNEKNYSDKGILLDLSDLEAGLTGEDALNQNLVDALRQDGKIYSLPVAFCIPMIAGEKDFVEGIHDISSLTEAVEEAREKNPEGVILTSTLPKGILTVLTQTESGNWVKDDGKLDEEALGEFLSCAYRLYETEKKGVGEEMVEAEKEELGDTIYMTRDLAARLEETYYDFNNTMIDIMLEEKLAAIGYVRNPINLCWVDQLPENYDLVPLQDGQGVGFKPVMKLAVNALASEPELAQEFARTALSAKAGKMEFSSGIPLNVTAAEWIMENPKEIVWHMEGVNNAGQEIDVNASWPLSETLEKYQDAIASADHVIEEDFFLKQKVIEICGLAMEKGKTVEKAVSEIKWKTAIYLAE